MALDAEIKQAITSYAFAHIADEEWHKNFFSFIQDEKLSVRLGEEFLSTRYIYKILEAIEADKWLLRAQIRIQVLSYASIYEAVLHHILFELIPDTPEVAMLTEFTTKKRISLPRDSMEALQRLLVHDGKEIIATYEAIGRTDSSKVRFDRKTECAFSLGFISGSLRDELIEFYEARNAIHIHAEIRKSLDYQLDLSKRAYLRMEPFREQVAGKLMDLGII